MTDSGGAVIRREPMTYERHAARSWFVDQVNAKRGNLEAEQRLARHAQEMDVELRANPTTRAGQGGEFAPPLWLIPLFAPSPAGGRILADLIDQVGNRFPLPTGVSSINLPRIVTGSSDQPQTQQGGAVPSADPTTGTVSGSGQVVTISGEIDMSQQLLDMTPAPGADAAMVIELLSDYNQSLETGMLFGTGSNGQLLGLANVTGRNSISGSGATTIATLWPAIGQMMAAVGDTRLQPVSHIIMAIRRWAWIASSVDSSSRPISSPGADSPRQPSYPLTGGDPYIPQDNFRAVGPINGCPVWQSGAILQTQAYPNAAVDQIFGVRPKDMFLWESDPKVLVATNPLSGTLQARVRYARYVAFVPDRYPQGIGVLTGVPAPANF